jgi:hypothetical protein
MNGADNKPQLQREIRGVSKTVRELLTGVKYSIDYYQREYKWETKQVQELIEDLVVRFNQDHDDLNDRTEVANYGHYFLGSIVISVKNGQKFIIDGQQRLTTLTLLLIFLNNNQRGREIQVNVKDMIFSEKYGKKSFNLDVPERTRCMEVLFNQESLDATDQPEAIKNILGRYADIESLFPPDIKDETLPYFIDWLIDNVHLVEITAYSDDDAYLIFETMNDRGLSLAATDMLKGFLLSNIKDDEKRNLAAAIWKKHTSDLAELGSEEVSDFFKTWLRSQYAESIRERKKHAIAQDFDRLGTEFHRWIREKHETISLSKPDEYFSFFERDLSFYSRQYQLIRKAALLYNPVLEDVFYISQLGFTLQYPVMMSPLNPEDSQETINQKVLIVARYIETLLARRIWNWHSISYSSLQYAMFIIMRDIRGKSPLELVDILSKRLVALEETFNNPQFSMHKMNRYLVHRLLARMTDTLERSSGEASHYLDYINVTGDPKNKYEVEHIWADHPERHLEEFSHPSDFANYRNRIGGLLLLPKKFNESYNDSTYDTKIKHYIKQNLLVQSLHPLCYEKNPGFRDFIIASDLPFIPHDHFNKADLDARQNLYCQFADYTWRISRLKEVLDNPES